MDPDEYHWMLWIVDKDISNGIVVHATNPSGSFIFEFKPWRAAKSMHLIPPLQIGHLGSHLTKTLVEALSKVPMHNTQVKDGVFNCRIWLGQALADLVEHGVIHCSSIPKLEQEAIVEADKVRKVIEHGTAKAAVKVSELSN